MERYQSLGRIGEGTYGKVWKCQNKGTGEVVAIKRFKEAEDADEQVLKTATREVRLLRALRSAHVVSLHETFSRRGRLHLVFEWVERTVLEDLRARPRGLGDGPTRQVLWQLARALDFLHSQQVIHRDVKPENVLLSKAGLMKLCDFGFAREMHVPVSGGGPAGAMSEYVATRWYRAPELLVGEKQYGPAVDVWALGCMAVEMQTGAPLFPGDSDLDQLWLILNCIGALAAPHQATLAKNPALKARGARLPQQGLIVEGLKVPASHEVETLEVRFRAFSLPLLQFLKACLHPVPEKRLSCKELLRLPYFHGCEASFPPEFWEEHHAAGLDAEVRRAASAPRRKRKSADSGCLAPPVVDITAVASARQSPASRFVPSPRSAFVAAQPAPAPPAPAPGVWPLQPSVPCSSPRPAAAQPPAASPCAEAAHWDLPHSSSPRRQQPEAVAAEDEGSWAPPAAAPQQPTGEDSAASLQLHHSMPSVAGPLQPMLSGTSAASVQLQHVLSSTSAGSGPLGALASAGSGAAPWHGLLRGASQLGSVDMATSSSSPLCPAGSPTPPGPGGQDGGEVTRMELGPLLLGSAAGPSSAEAPAPLDGGSSPRAPGAGESPLRTQHPLLESATRQRQLALQCGYGDSPALGRAGGMEEDPLRISGTGGAGASRLRVSVPGLWSPASSPACSPSPCLSTPLGAAATQGGERPARAVLSRALHARAGQRLAAGKAALRAVVDQQAPKAALEDAWKPGTPQAASGDAIPALHGPGGRFALLPAAVRHLSPFSRLATSQDGLAQQPPAAAGGLQQQQQQQGHSSPVASRIATFNALVQQRASTGGHPLWRSQAQSPAAGSPMNMSPRGDPVSTPLPASALRQAASTGHSLHDSAATVHQWQGPKGGPKVHPDRLPVRRTLHMVPQEQQSNNIQPSPMLVEGPGGKTSPSSLRRSSRRPQQC